MALTWITVNANLKKGICLINTVPKDVFLHILKQLTEQTKSGTCFTQEELHKFEDSTKLSKEDLQLLIRSLAYILKQASKIILKPTTFFSHLNENLKIDTEKTEEIVAVWTEDIRSSFNIEDRKRLEDVSWEVDLEIASNVCYKKTIPTARLQLGLTSVKNDNKENVILHLDEEELTSLFRTIENIQIKLDAINQASKQ